MRIDKKSAIKLRLENKSYNEINKILGVPKSTLSEWFRNNKQSTNIKTELTKIALERSTRQIRLMNKENSLKWKKWREDGRREATELFPNLSNNPLFIAGLMLYWAEGDNKLQNPCKFTNTDPRMIRLYIKFLTKILKIAEENIRIMLILYPDLSENRCIGFWSRTINISKRQFYKSQYIKGRHPTKRLAKGICMVSMNKSNNGQLKEKIIVWIDLLSKKL